MIYRLGGQKNITVEVNNILVNKPVRNVFGVIEGSVDSGSNNIFLSPLTVSCQVILLATFLCMCVCADRAVVLGAQRDAWGKGYTKATVGTSVLMQLARVVREMVEKGDKDWVKFGLLLCFKLCSHLSFFQQITSDPGGLWCLPAGVLVNMGTLAPPSG